MVCARICVCEYCTHTQNKHIDAIYYHYEWPLISFLFTTFDQHIAHFLSLSSYLSCHSYSVHVVFFYVYLFDHSFLPNLPHPSRLYSYLLPPYLPTCSYLHSLTIPFLFSCLPTCPQTGHMPTWHQVYLTALYPQQSSSKRYLKHGHSLTPSLTLYQVVHHSGQHQ